MGAFFYKGKHKDKENKLALASQERREKYKGIAIFPLLPHSGEKYKGILIQFDAKKS